MYGIFVSNQLLRDVIKEQTQRTVMMGQICMIETFLANKALQVRLLKDGETWESQTFLTNTENCVLTISEKLWPYIAAISSPQERVKLAKNKSLCEKLKTVSKDITVGFVYADDVKLGKIKFMGQVKGIGHCYGLEMHVSCNSFFKFII